MIIYFEVLPKHYELEQNRQGYGKAAFLELKGNVRFNIYKMFTIRRGAKEENAVIIEKRTNVLTPQIMLKGDYR